jgi:hypothetical protein
VVAEQHAGLFPSAFLHGAFYDRRLNDRQHALLVVRDELVHRAGGPEMENTGSDDGGRPRGMGAVAGQRVAADGSMIRARPSSSLAKSCHICA